MNKTCVSNVPTIITKDLMTQVVPHVFKILNQITTNQNVFARQDTLKTQTNHVSHVQAIHTKAQTEMGNAPRVPRIKSQRIQKRVQRRSRAVIVSQGMACTITFAHSAQPARHR
jgi:hypothetical protein